MNMVRQQAADGLVSKLIRYSTAVGTGALLSPLALADWVEFKPDGGLPIVIDTDDTEDSRVYIDIDGDEIDDYSIYYADKYGENTTYGGGFFIEPVSRYGVQITYENLAYFNRAVRNDLTEFVTVQYTPYWFPDITTSRALIDANEVTANTPAYTPFRDNPGFLGLMLNDGANAGTFKVVVNSDGTRVTILNGAYRTDDYSLRLDEGFLLSDGFESAPASKYFPPGLATLATGSSE